MIQFEIGVLLGLLFLGDIVATFIYLNHIRHRYPKIDYKEFEINMIVKWAWGKFGFYGGTLIAPLLLSPFWMLILVGCLHDEKFLYMVVGMYMLLYVLHFSNLIGIALNQQTNFSRIYDKVYGGK